MSSKWMTPQSDPVALPEGATQILRGGKTVPDGTDIPVDLARGDLLALLRTEIRRSFHDGHPFRIEHFRKWLDRVSATADDWFCLIVDELCLRHEFGPPASVDEYAKRFPELGSRVAEAFACAIARDADAPTQREMRTGDSLVSLFRPHTPGSSKSIELIPPPTNIVVPGYEILSVLGRGGMGVVFKARQTGLNRLVALKMILAGSHAKPADLARFRQEAEAVAALRHPNIVQIHEIGEHQGVPYFSMEYVEGGTLAKKIGGQPQPAPFAAAIAESLARAIHTAHLRNIIHRDLKPANVLLSEEGSAGATTQIIANEIIKLDHPAPKAKTEDSPTNGTTVPKITDFGLAKRLDNTLQLTTSGLVAGTPQYMAPEQVGRGAPVIGPAVDIYSIGVILYESLTGRPPFLGSTPAEIMQQVLHQEPVPLRELQPKTPRDLETICLKCLQKEPNKRYGSAELLADDLSRFRKHQHILARPVGKFEQATRWCHRNPAVASLVFVIAIMLVGGVGIASYLALMASDSAARALANEREARRQEQVARENADQLFQERHAVQTANQQLSAAHLKLTHALEEASKARLEEERLRREAVERENLRSRELFNAEMIQAQRAWETGHVAHTRRLLAVHEPVRHDQTDHRGFEWHYLSRLANSDGVRFSVPDGCRSLALSPDGKQVIWAFHDRCDIWSLDGVPSRIANIEGHQGSIDCVAYDPNGKRIATAGHDKSIKIWSSDNRKLVQTIADLPRSAFRMRFSPDGELLAALMGDITKPLEAGGLMVWDVKSGERKWANVPNQKAVYDLAFSANGADRNGLPRRMRQTLERLHWGGGSHAAPAARRLRTLGGLVAARDATGRWHFTGRDFRLEHRDLERRTPS